MTSKRIHATWMAVVVFLVAAATAQEETKQLAHVSDPVAEPAMGPPEQLKKADFMVGKWNVAVNMRMSADAAWEESSATAETNRALNDSVFRTKFVGSMAGMDFEGEEILTYNRDTNRWESYWFDSMSAKGTIFKGGFDGGGNLLLNAEDTVEGKPALVRSILIPKSADEYHWKMEMSFDKGSNWIETGKLVYTRM